MITKKTNSWFLQLRKSVWKSKMSTEISITTRNLSNVWQIFQLVFHGWLPKQILKYSYHLEIQIHLCRLCTYPIHQILQKIQHSLTLGSLYIPCDRKKNTIHVLKTIIKKNFLNLHISIRRTRFFVEVSYFL